MQKHLKNSHLYQYINRDIFNSLVKKWGMDKGVTKFSTWEMTCGLITTFVSRLSSYREVELSLGIPRSTLSDALLKRSYGFYNNLCDEVLLEIRKHTTCRKVKKAVREILALDSSEIQIHGSLFSIPLWKKKFCKGHQAAAKLHVIWNVCGEWVEDFMVTPGRKNDSPVASLLKLIPGKTYVFDRAYNDLSFWYKIMCAKSHFVTRLKNVPRNKMMLIKAKIKKSDRCRILYDGIYRPTKPTLARHPEVPKDIQFRHIIYRDPETKKIFHFVTSDWRASASEIADIYRKRWAVELLFKWLKGHLNIRYLASKSVNAVKVQLAIAVLVQLLLQLKRLKEKFEGSLWQLLRLIRANQIQRTLQQSDFHGDCRWELTSIAEVKT